MACPRYPTNEAGVFVETMSDKPPSYDKVILVKNTSETVNVANNSIPTISSTVSK